MPGGQYTNLKRAGARARHRRHALAGGGAHLRRGQRHVRRHHQGDADLQGGGRHGAADGDQRPDARRGARSGHRDRLSRVGGAAVSRRSRPAVWRLSARTAAQGAQGRRAAHAATGPGHAAGRPDAAARRGERDGRARGDRPAVRLLPDVPEGVHRVRRGPAALQRRRDPADRGVLLRHGAGTGNQRRSGARQDADRALRDAAASRTRTARARYSSNSTASRARCA